MLIVCDPQSRTDYGSLSGNYTYDTVNNVYLINSGDTIIFDWFFFTCHGSLSEKNLFRNGIEYYLAADRGLYKYGIYEPGKYYAVSCCGCYDTPTNLWPWGFSFTVAYNNPNTITNLCSTNTQVTFRYSASDNQLFVKAFNLTGVAAKLSIFDLMGREILLKDIYFNQQVDNIGIDIGNFVRSGFYIAYLQYGAQNFTYKFAKY